MADPVCQVVAVPYPGKSHVNAMMNLCKLLVSRRPDLLITFVVTEELLGHVSSHRKLVAIQIATVPDVLPCESDKSLDLAGFFEAVMTKLEAPFEQLLDSIGPPVTAIIGDVELGWAIDLGRRLNIPVAVFWTMPATFFSMLYHLQVFAQSQDSPVEVLVQTAEKIPGISSTNMVDLRQLFRRSDLRFLKLSLECISHVPKAHYLLFTSVYELEARVVDSLDAVFPFPVYNIGPAIPYLQLKDVNNGPDYEKWLDLQPVGSVLYVSLGSFLSVSRTQMNEMLAGLEDSGVRYMWVAREEALRLKEICSERGLVLPWCDQLKVLCHSSVGGFWTHCGSNSMLEAVFAGVPMLTFPLFLDQGFNSNQIVEDWRIGWRVLREMGDENLVTRDRISHFVRKFMDLESGERREMSKRAKELMGICRAAISEVGSSIKNIDMFINNAL